MSYGSTYGFGGWGPQPRRDREFYEKVWLRKGLDAWDAKWHDLSHAARLMLINDIKGTGKTQNRATATSVPADKLPPQTLKELVAAGFVTIQPSPKPKQGERVVAAEGLSDFFLRVRALWRYHLLAEGDQANFSTYLSNCYFTSETWGSLSAILRKAGIEDFHSPDDLYKRYVRNHRWPGWVVAQVPDPLMEKVVAVVRAAEKPVPLVELPQRLPKHDPAQVRAAVDKLVGYLVLFEDLRRPDLEIVVGLLPAVHEGLEQAGKPRKCPPLVVCESPKAVGPEASVVVNDLRAYLLEIASDPPRLRQDRMLFQKEVDRFLEIVEPLPEWFTERLKWTPEGRINTAHSWGMALGLLKEKVQGKEIRLHSSPKGHSWLGGTLAEQYTELYNFLRAPAKANEQYSAFRSFLFTADAGTDPYSSYGVGDSRFLGVNVTSLSTKKGRPSLYYYDIKPQDQQTLRDSVFRALDTLPAGVFHRLDSVVNHLAFGPNNPLHLGQKMESVTVYWGGRPVPALEEVREEKAQAFLEALIAVRLVPLGCFQTAVDEAGRFCVARTARLDAYFGLKGAKLDFGGAADGEAKVVVQPDFSVVVIGLNPTPAAELAPFCERTTRNAGAGAVVFKLTRDSVVKAVGHGLKPDEIVARLKRHASNDLPANVLREVQDWCAWVRRVAPAVVTVLRCGNRETADRVASALGKQAERLGDSMIVLPQGRLTPAERAKLQSQGVLVSAAADGLKEPKPKKKKAKRRSYYYDD